MQRWSLVSMYMYAIWGDLGKRIGFGQIRISMVEAEVIEISSVIHVSPYRAPCDLRPLSFKADHQWQKRTFNVISLHFKTTFS